jgi:hypothetical protein
MDKAIGGGHPRADFLVVAETVQPSVPYPSFSAGVASPNSSRCPKKQGITLPKIDEERQ